jgi:hypothetical protein
MFIPPCKVQEMGIGLENPAYSIPLYCDKQYKSRELHTGNVFAGK